MQRVRGAGRDRQPLRKISRVCFGLATLFIASEATAQSLTGGPINAATGRSLADAVSQNEQVLIERQVLGGSAGGGASSGALGSFSSGRLRSSDHDALRAPGLTQSFSFDTTETSAFANVVVGLPGTVLGGQMKVSGFVGHNDVSLDLKSNALSVLDPNQSGSAENQSIIFGGTALWSLRNTYALATLVGTWGQTTLHDSVDDCGYDNPAHPTGCNHNRYTFGTAGMLATLTAGQVFDLAGPSGPKLDLRGSLGYVHNTGQRFKNVFGNEQKYTFSTFTGTAAATLFSNMALAEGAYLRPYIQGYLRQEWGYRSGFDFFVDPTEFGTVRLQQDHLYGGVDVGVTYTQGNTTFGAALYFEASGDDQTLGGRLGLSQKLDGLPQQGRPFTWSGFYVGINAGMAWGEADAGSAAVCNDTKTIDGTDKGNDCPFAQNQLGALAAAGTGSMSDRSFLGGAQAGVNLQRGSALFGFELDVQSFKLGAARAGTRQAGPDNFVTVATSFDTDWLVTARSRLGWLVSPQTLIYLTGGVAATDLYVKNSLTSVSAFPAEGVGSSNGRAVGWTLGGGAELALGGNWTLRGEYLYLDFGKVTANAQVFDANHAEAGTNNNLATSVDLTAHVVRAALNYKF